MTLEELLKLLKADDFHINKHKEEMHGYKVWLGCKLIICVYKSGKILVQGKFDPHYGEESMRFLIPLLPPETRWMIEEAFSEPFKSLILERQGPRGKR